MNTSTPSSSSVHRQSGNVSSTGEFLGTDGVGASTAATEAAATTMAGTATPGGEREMVGGTTTATMDAVSVETPVRSFADKDAPKMSGIIKPVGVDTDPTHQNNLSNSISTVILGSNSAANGGVSTGSIANQTPSQGLAQIPSGFTMTTQPPTTDSAPIMPSSIDKDDDEDDDEDESGGSPRGRARSGSRGEGGPEDDVPMTFPQRVSPSMNGQRSRQATACAYTFVCTYTDTRLHIYAVSHAFSGTDSYTNQPIGCLWRDVHRR